MSCCIICVFRHVFCHAAFVRIELTVMTVTTASKAPFMSPEHVTDRQTDRRTDGRIAALLNRDVGLTLSGLGLDIGLMASGLGLIEIGLVASNIYSAHDIN